MSTHNPTEEQIKGHEDHVKERDERCERILSIYNEISPARQKAIDFVKRKAKEAKTRKDFLK